MDGAFPKPKTYALNTPAPEGPEKRPRDYRVWCDESGTHGGKYYGYGAIFIPHDRRGDFTGLMKALREKHGFTHELKWSKVSKANLAFCLDLVRAFFARPWMLFHMLVVERAYVDMDLHKDREDAYRKHLVMFLRKRIAFLNNRAKDKQYHVIVDKLPWRYRKGEEATHTILNNCLRHDIDEHLVKTLTSRESHEDQGIQLVDLLLGATLSAWQGDATAPAKVAVMKEIARHLGWEDTHSDTLPGEVKFNIWHFQDRRDQRRIVTRKVKLLIPWTGTRTR